MVCSLMSDISHKVTSTMLPTALESIRQELQRLTLMAQVLHSQVDISPAFREDLATLQNTLSRVQTDVYQMSFVVERINLRIVHGDVGHFGGDPLISGGGTAAPGQAAPTNTAPMTTGIVAEPKGTGLYTILNSGELTFK